MIKKLILIAIVIGDLSSCEVGESAKTVTPPTPVINSTKISNAIPSNFVSLPKKKGGECHIDVFKLAGEDYIIAGWAAISAKDGSSAEDIVLGIPASGKEKFISPVKQKREDLVNAFKKTSLMDSGFNVEIKKTDVPSLSKVIFYQIFKGEVYTCEVIAKL